MPEVLIRLERPASVTPELRAWIGHRLGTGGAVLSRSRPHGSDPGGLVLKLEVQSDSDFGVREEVTDLLTDLRLLGLRPTLLSAELVV
jgi:hypothetical protein